MKDRIGCEYGYIAFTLPAKPQSTLILTSCEVERRDWGKHAENQHDMLNVETAEIPIALELFTQQMGWSDTTAWRYRRDKKLTTTNIAGRLYIMPSDLREFNRRAVSGEFAKTHVAPKKKKLTPEDASFVNQALN